VLWSFTQRGWIVVQQRGHCGRRHDLRTMRIDPFLLSARPEASRRFGVSHNLFTILINLGAGARTLLPEQDRRREPCSLLLVGLHVALIYWF